MNSRGVLHHPVQSRCVEVLLGERTLCPAATAVADESAATAQPRAHALLKARGHIEATKLSGYHVGRLEMKLVDFRFVRGFRWVLLSSVLGAGACSGDPVEESNSAVDCLPGQIQCGTSCVDPNVDPVNCGDCGVLCPACAAVI